MTYETNCTEINLAKWNELMKNKRKISYKWLVSKIKKQFPEIYEKLALDFPNPYDYATFSTLTHYILTHSGIEYFFKK